MKNPLKNTEPINFKEGKTYKLKGKVMEFTKDEDLARKLAIMKGKKRVKRIKLKNGKVGYLV